MDKYDAAAAAVRKVIDQQLEKIPSIWQSAVAGEFTPPIRDSLAKLFAKAAVDAAEAVKPAAPQPPPYPAKVLAPPPTISRPSLTGDKA